MPINEDDLAYEFFKETIEQEAPTETVETPNDTTVVETPAAEVVTPEPVTEPVVVPEPPVIETAEPEYKSNKKYIPLDDEKAIYETLDRKYRYERMKPEEKALAFIAKENPGLDDDELMFIASSEYGIGVEKPDESVLTDEQIINLKKQDIARKQLLHKADAFFKEETSKITLEAIDPLETDEGFKTYQTERQAQAAKVEQERRNLQNTIQQIETAAKVISEIKEPIEIDLDESKLTFEVNFKLDEKKQKQLVEKTKQYIPSEAEVSAYTDPTTGKFDFKGYMEYLTPMFFAKEMKMAAIKQAIAQDREQFVEGTLKNSTLRNNDVSKVVTKDFDVVDSWPFGR